jgi:Ca2+-binding RTX toxin-like protein
VEEAANGGIDTIIASVSLTLAANVENARLIANPLTVIGNDLNNVITGNIAADTIDGGKGGDLLRGFGGTDKLNGGDGDDVIEGGLGVDTIDGGAGNDLFRYTLDSTADLNTIGGDLIIGFEVGKDKLDVYDLFEDFDLSAMDVVGEGIMRLLVNGNDTLVQFDKDGGADSFVTLAVLQNVTNATLADVIYPQDNGGV